MDAKKSYVLRSDNEIIQLIDIIHSENCMAILDAKRQRNAEVFAKVARKLDVDGKPMEICRAKFKILKDKYKCEWTLSSKSGENYNVFI